MTMDDHKFTGMYRGKVLATDANESNQYGRLKVEVYPMMLGKATAVEQGKLGNTVEGMTTSQMPWAVPATPLFSGAGSGHGWFAVPEVGSYVFVFFLEGDINQPVYFAEAPTGSHGLPASRTTNYPARRVLRTKAGLEVIFDDTDTQIDIKQPTGSYIRLDSDGNIKVVATGDVDVQSEGDTNITSEGDTQITTTKSAKVNSTEGVQVTSVGPVTVTSSSTVTITGTAVSINT